MNVPDRKAVAMSSSSTVRAARWSNRVKAGRRRRRRGSIIARIVVLTRHATHDAGWLAGPAGWSPRRLQTCWGAAAGASSDEMIASEAAAICRSMCSTGRLVVSSVHRRISVSPANVIVCSSSSGGGGVSGRRDADSCGPSVTSGLVNK